MQMTVREAFQKKVDDPWLTLTLQGNLVYQLKRPYPGATSFIVQFDDRGLPPVHLNEGDLIEVEDWQPDRPALTEEQFRQMYIGKWIPPESDEPAHK